MGIESRDYIRENHTGDFRLPHSGSLWAIKYLLIANIAVYLLQHSMGGFEVIRGIRHFDGGLTDWFSLNLSNMYSFQIWRLVTYGFCHSYDLKHLLINMFVLWMFGRAVEPIYGSREFLAFFLTGVIVSGVCHMAMQGFQESPAGVIGASGGVMAVVFLTAMNFPRMKVLLMFVIPIELRWLAVIYAVADVAGFVQGESNVAHAAHLGGAGFGVAYKHYGWQMYGFWNRLRGGIRLPRFGSRPKVRLYKPSVSGYEKSRRDLDSQVDKILDKISKQGEASLTDDERKLLKEASEKYKKR